MTTDDGRTLDAVGRLRAAAEMLRNAGNAVADDPEPTPDDLDAIRALGIGALFMSPPVALALADWLDAEAYLIEGQLGYPDLHTRPNFGRLAQMEALTNAILGTRS
ncbi:hypothetical protein [Aeromicrobium sp. 9AM]|uniref:hypothetical protein n=1 Tax=Aeromicrobium sp. 9AM TaxID=2653126 RepID=UPI0012F20557|nr:hypothetical protein [Aeromicrobium sp. 9AM]VXC07703.1 hypothetical protein AERO9AM_30618 [Aeromicrobium sp. 9AM]